MAIRHFHPLVPRRLTLSITGVIVLSVLLSGCGSPSNYTFLPTKTQGSVVPTSTEIIPTAAPTKTEPAPTETSTATPLPSPTETPEPTLTATATPLPELITDEYGVPMALVPAGNFVMGSDKDQAEAKPAHTVYLDSYYMDVNEVTDALYLECAEAGICITGGGSRLRNPVFADYPVMDVTWYDAAKYCEWRGARLPTEAEWEKAARGTDERKYPWGNDPVTCERSRYGDCGWFAVAVGLHPEGASPYGIQDMAGNAWEWTADWYKADYYKVSPTENPTGPEESTGWKSTRGGAWFYMADLMSSIWRNHAPPTAAYSYLGFRCAKNP